MNLFVIDTDPCAAAAQLPDRHVVKMPVEVAQMLAVVCAEHGLPLPRKLDGTPYRVTHANHPVTRWVCSSGAAVRWALMHGLALCDEYRARYGREHGTRSALASLFYGGLRALQGDAAAPFVQCVPEQYRQADPVAAYRAYMVAEKSRIATWRQPAARPAWWPTASECSPQR